MIVRFKRLHDDAILPKYAKDGDAGQDFYATDNGTEVETPFGGRYIEYSTGWAVEIPRGHVGLMFPRSSISNYPLALSNGTGIFDSGYRNEVKFRFRITGSGKRYEKGERIGQMVVMPYPQVTAVEVDELSISERGQSGWGSSGL